MKRTTKFKIKIYTISFSRIIIGTFIMAIGIGQFLVPNHLSSGGFSGIATIGYYLLDIPIGTILLIINIPIFLLSYFKIGKKFLFRSIIGTFLLSVFLDWTQTLPVLTNDRLLASIYGGILVGLGTALTLKSKASTGGSDMIANIIRAYKPEQRTGNLIVIIDIIIVTLNVLFFNEIEIGLYSTITIYIMGKIIDVVFEGVYFTKQLFIISPKYQKISDRINTEIKRGTTGIYGRGMYKNEEITILLCVASRAEVIKIIQIIKKIDKRAFIITSNAREVIGRGFKT